MRVLQVHNRYASSQPSGENAVVDDEATSLTAAGVEVLRYLRSSDEIATMSWTERLVLPLQPLHGTVAVRDVRKAVQSGRPDIVHIHNTNPLISMSVVRTVRELGVPVVMTAHNYRHVCVAGTLRRNTEPCTSCRGLFLPWPAVVHGCYRSSRPQSLVAATALVAHRADYARVSRFIAVSGSIGASLELAGVPASRITVKGNAVPDLPRGTVVGPGPWPPRFLYIGRFEEEKGVELLLEAWSLRPPRDGAVLAFAGSGSLEGDVQRFAAQRTDVEVLGRLDRAGVVEAMAQATAVLVPSIWDEPFGLVGVEAFRSGRPILTTAAGGLADVARPAASWVVPPRAAAWAVALGALDEAAALEKGRAARALYLEEFDPTSVTRQLIDIYRSVLTSPDTA